MEAKDETKTLWEELPHKALDNGPGAFQLADGRIAYLAFAKKDGFPSVDQRAGLTVAPNAGSVEDFVQRHEQEPTLVRQVRNKVRKCAGCGKPNAFTLPHCNGCGLDLSTTAISFTNNVFVGFVYGIEKGPFPLTVSLRYEDEESLVFDDLLALSPCHLNSVPTTAYIPDWRYLLKDPVQGLALIDRLFGRCWQAVEEQFYADEAWHAKILKSGVTLAQLKDHVVAGFNYPPSQYHLHIQFIVPPFLPFQWALYLQGVHFTPGRFFPVEYVRAVLQLNAPLAEPDTMPIEDVVSHYKGKGVDYDEVFRQCYARYGASHEALAQWQRQDFGGVGVLGGGPERVYRFTSAGDALEAATEADAKTTQAADKAALQNYGRPYTAEGKPRGSYYGHTKSFPDSFPDY